ncbi:beta-lactamase [Skeletonema marinoi]|uniref:Beta-lactamase n=1 Tax=Skeletonema marinoi TaxID=267567 RepID=A0AAD9D760_9STRA|nr:beta-lactamase [Skeletonema marinoi]
MKIIASAVSLLASLSSCNAEASLLRATISTDDRPTPTVIDLSQDIPRDEAAISSSPGSKAVQEAAAEDPLLRNAMVIENGSIVSSYHRDDVDPNETHEVNSVTKSWMSLLFGIMVDDGLLSLDTTLGEIFSNDDEWADVTDGSTDFRKGVTVRELLTMTSGLIDNHRMSQGTTHGGQSLEGALSYPDVDIEVKGEWEYLINSNIFSYIIVELTGMTPRQFSAERVMGKLGVGEDEYGWGQNDDGVEAGGGAMFLTPMQMAKFGQLYLQGGRTSPSNDERVISEEWIDASFTHHSTTDWSSVGMGHVNRLNGNPYGYLFCGIEYPSRSTVYCAFGTGGQLVCVDRDLGRVLIATRENNGKNEGFSDMFNVVDVALEKTLSFCAPNGGLSGISSTVESRAE